MPSLAQLDEEIAAKQKNLHDLFAKYGDEWETKMPADEAALCAPMNDELTKLAKEREELFKRHQIRQGVIDANGNPTGAPNVLQNQKPNEGTGAKVRDIGSILRESKEYAAFREGGIKTARFSLTEPEFKTLITLTTINNPPTRAPGIQESIQDETTVADLMLSGSTNNNRLSYMEETTFTNAAATVAEGDPKPESALAFTERTDDVRKIATWIPMTEEALNDVSGLESYVRGRLVFMVRREEEDQLLNGNGTAPNISGILDRSIQTQAKGTDPTPDAVYKAMTKVRVTGQAEPTAFVVHPNDWQDIRLLRTADGVYIWGSPADAGPERIWGLTVRQTSLIAENTGLVGAFRPFAQVFRRSGIDITISTEHSTFFVENKVAILAEERLALAVYRPYAFCSVTGI